MASFQIKWKRSATKELRALPKDAVARITDLVSGLSSNPFPPGVRKIVGSTDTYRLRAGDYRVIYTVAASILVIEIIRVGHRKDVYDR